MIKDRLLTLANSEFLYMVVQKIKSKGEWPAVSGGENSVVINIDPAAKLWSAVGPKSDAANPSKNLHCDSIFRNSKTDNLPWNSKCSENNGSSNIFTIVAWSFKDGNRVIIALSFDVWFV